MKSAGKILDKHFQYHQLIIDCYSKRGISSKFLKTAKDACIKQIQMSLEAKAVFLVQYPYDKMVPGHHGYKQLTIILEKEGEIADAIMVAKRALSEGWNGDWEKRIQRYEKKLENHK